MHCGIERSDGADQHISLPLEVVFDLSKVVEREPLGEEIDAVHDIIEFSDEGVDVLAVKGRDERAVQAIQRGVGQRIGSMLQVANLLNLLVHVRERVGHGAQCLGRRDDVVRQTVKKIEELGVAGKQVEHEACYRV